jgi:hypothetical protein
MRFYSRQCLAGKKQWARRHLIRLSLVQHAFWVLVLLTMMVAVVTAFAESQRRR